MRDPARIPVVTDLILKFWQERPDLRLGQVISLFENAARRKGLDPFVAEENEWLKIISELLKEQYCPCSSKAEYRSYKPEVGIS